MGWFWKNTTRPCSAVPEYDREIKIQIFGDSITDTKWGDRRTWVSFLPKQLGNSRIELVNNAIGGGMLTAVPGKKNSVVRLACNGRMLHPDSDLVIIFAGTNDWGYEIDRLGTLGCGDPATVYGAVRTLSTYIRAHCTGQLLFLTPTQRFNYKDQACPRRDAVGNTLNGRGYSLRELSDAIVNACAAEGVECLDLYRESGITLENISAYTIDGLHPNISGDQRIAACIYDKLQKVLLHHPKPNP